MTVQFGRLRRPMSALARSYHWRDGSRYLRQMDPRSVMVRYFDAWRCGDGGALEEILADDVHASGPLATVDGGARHAASLAQSSSLFRDIVIEHMVVDDQTVLTWLSLELRNGTTTAACNRCEVVEGLVRRVQIVFDPRPLIDAARE